MATFQIPFAKTVGFTFENVTIAASKIRRDVATPISPTPLPIVMALVAAETTAIAIMTLNIPLTAASADS